MDVDEKTFRPVFHITFADGSTYDTPMVDGTGDNGLIQVDFNFDNVKKVDLEFWGSGSIAEIQYKYPQKCVTPNPVSRNFDSEREDTESKHKITNLITIRADIVP